MNRDATNRRQLLQMQEPASDEWTAYTQICSKKWIGASLICEGTALRVALGTGRGTTVAAGVVMAGWTPSIFDRHLAGVYQKLQEVKLYERSKLSLKHSMFASRYVLESEK